MLVALTTGQRLGIALVAAAFIVFALASSFLFPRRKPDFPGRRLPLFVFASVIFFAGTLTTMILLAHEDTEAHPIEMHGTETEPGETGAGETEPQETEAAGEGEADADVEAGSELWASEGCGGCHVLADAGSTGTVGPNLDESQPDFEASAQQIREGGGGMPAFGGRLSDDQIRDLAAYVVGASGGE